uniref:ManC n=1 Tax=Escherichia albertii TaxID=208962 RepID=A0A5P8N5Q8_ESCAL|nr:ManC [Escherichia albertii]
MYHLLVLLQVQNLDLTTVVAREADVMLLSLPATTHPSLPGVQVYRAYKFSQHM